ncbi:hypothetical protein BH24ACT26_BH24ACT26_20780 [soil metagenome]
MTRIESCSRLHREAAKISGENREATKHFSGAAASRPVFRDTFYRARGGPQLMKVRLIGLASALMALFHVAGANFKY